MLAALVDAPRSAPRLLDDLDPVEHLLLWSLRAMATGHDDCPALAQTFDRLCGPMGQAVLQAHFVLVRLIGLAARRQMRVHAPGCPCVGADETAIIGLAAAAQQALRARDDGLLGLRLDFLVERRSAEAVRCAALGLAQALSLGGRELPVRMEETATEAGRPRLVH